jgi:hypothetical protein
MAREQANDTCWQCGAPADPSCACIQSLISRRPYADALGYPVKKNTWGRDVVKVSIPRCEACQLRNYVVGFVMFAGFFAGACFGGLEFPSKGLTTIAGGALGLMIPWALVSLYDHRVRGFRSIGAYPPLRQLHAAGWEDPN